MQEDFDIPKLPQETNKMKLNKNILVFLGISVLILIVLGFFGYQYIAPFGARITYQFTSDKNSDKASKLLGANKSGTIETNAVNSLIIPQQIIRNNIVTFNLKLLSKKIDGIWVSLKFKGDPKEIKIGVRGSEKESYLYQPLYNQILNSLSWSQTTNGKTTFWQREKKYKDISELVSKPPISDLPKVASYFYNPSDIVMKENSSLSQSNTKIEKTLRGTHTLLVKVDNNQLNLIIEKQDRNDYKGPDQLNVAIYKGDSKIFTKVIPDDGIEGIGGLKLASQKENIKIKDIERGIYKVTLLDKSNGADVSIKSIIVNQSGIVFLAPIFIVDDNPTKLWTNSTNISVITLHPGGLQNIKIDEKNNLEIKESVKTYPFNLNENKNSTYSTSTIHLLEIPKNDLSIKGDGFFSFSKDSFFNPEPIETIDLSQVTELDNIDYIIANYQKVKNEGDWKVAQVYFDPKDIKIDQDKLYFSLESPGLSENNGEIAIDSLGITVDKPGWFDSTKQNLTPIGTTIKKEGILDKFINFFKNLWPFKSTINHKPSAINNKSTNTPTPTPTLKQSLKISVQNGGGTVGIATKYTDLLKTAGFKNVESGNSPSDIKNATISYNKDEGEKLTDTIDNIKEILSKEYETIDTNTNADKGKIVIILGEIPKPTPTASPSAR